MRALHRRLPLLVTLALIFFAQVAFRLWWSWKGLRVTAYPDEVNYYLAAAQAIHEQGWGFFSTERSLWNGPLNPVWIAFWRNSIFLTKVANLSLLSLAGVCLWDSARRLFGGRAAWIALLCYLLYPPLLNFGGTILTEPLFVSLLIFSTWCLTFDNSPRALGHWAAGIFLGIATLTRPTIQLLPFLLLVAAGWFFLRHGERERRYALGLVKISLGALLLTIPWTIRNYLHFHKAGIANGFGAVLFLGNDLTTSGDEPIYSELDFDTFEVTKPFTHLDIEGDRRLTQAALARVKAHPAQLAALTAVKPFKFLFGHRQHYFYPAGSFRQYWRIGSKRTALALVFEIGLTAVFVSFGIVGLFFSQVGSVLRVWGWAFIAYMTALHSIAFAIPRLALPLFPILILFAVGVFCKGGSRWRLALPALTSMAAFAWNICGSVDFNRALVPPSYQQGFDVRTPIAVEHPELHELTQTAQSEFFSTGNDPYLVFPLTAFEGRKNQVVLIEIEASTQRERVSALPLELFWSAEAQDFSQTKSKAISILPDGRPRWYRISPSFGNSQWSGPISRLRLDFADRELGARYKILHLVLAE